MKNEILIVEDNENYLYSLCNILEGEFAVIKSTSLNDAIQKISPNLSLALLDIRLNDADPNNKDGLVLLKEIKKENSFIPVIMITAYGDIDVAVEAMKLGASDFVQKEKVSFTDIKKLIKSLIEKASLERRVNILEKEIERLEPTEIVGKDKRIKEIKRIIKEIANDGEIPVIIMGETGTGKELVARAIHSQGRRRNGPFVVVAISSLNKESIVSELFGHEKGSFTGAISRKIGYIEESNGGVLFLDEIGDLDKDIQIKLLRTIEEKKITRMGSTKPINVDFHLVVATNKDIKKLVKDGYFREDLYYRIKGVEIILPPLRERKSDIPILSQYFLDLMRKNGESSIKEISNEVMSLFMRYSWPGNVRELKHTIEVSAFYAKVNNSDTILMEHLPIEIREGTFAIKKEWIISKNGIKIDEEKARLELMYIEQALKMCNGKKTEMWKLLGYNNRFTIIRRIKKIKNNYPQLWEKFNYLREKYVRS